MRIGGLAQSTGVTAQTVRFYEREGLLPEPARNPNGYRAYAEEMIGEILFIRECLDAGFTLKEIKHLKALDPDRSSSCVEMSKLLRRKIRSIDEKIAALRRVRGRLGELEENCSHRPPSDPCPALSELHS